jgi:hypothetical protein
MSFRFQRSFIFLFIFLLLLLLLLCVVHEEVIDRIFCQHNSKNLKKWQFNFVQL